MNQRVLLVDDDTNLLEASRRQYRNHFDLVCAEGAHEALAMLDEGETFAVVVSDMHMPGLDGLQLLQQVRERTPDTVRMLLTGNATLQLAIDGVNEGAIFRFLLKPCPIQTFSRAVEDGIEQHRLITAERELLSKTLRGGIKVLTDVLALVNSTAFGRGARVQRLVCGIAKELKVEAAWQCEIAAMLSQVGCVAVPEDTLVKVIKNAKLSEDEARLYDAHPTIARDLIGNIPRLDKVAEMIAHQDTRYDGVGSPEGGPCGESIPVGARILKVALDYDALVSAGHSERFALAEILGRVGWYDPQVVQALKKVLAVDVCQAIQSVSVSELPDNAVLAADVRTLTGRLLMARGQEVSPSLRARLQFHATIVGVEEPIRILVPLEDESEVGVCQA